MLLAVLMGRSPNLAPGTKALLIRYNKGTVGELAAEFSVHRRTVSRHLTRAGVQRRRRGQPPEIAETARRLYLEGLTVTEVADNLGMAASTVLYGLHRDGIAIRPARRRPTSRPTSYLWTHPGSLIVPPP